MTGAEPSRRLSGDLVLLVLTIFWGVTFIVVKAAVARVDPVTFVLLRFALGAVAVSAVARGALADRTALKGGILLGAFLFLGFAFQTSGLVYTTPSRSAFLTGMSVLLVPFVSLGLYRRWPRLPSLVGVVFAVVGLYALTGGLTGESGATWRGDVLSFSCAVAFAFHITLTEHFAPRTTISALVAIQLWTVALLSALVLPFTGPHRLEVDVVSVGAILFCGLAMSAGAIFVQTWGQARTTAVRAALIFSLEPVFAAAYSVASGGEVLGRAELLGGSLILLGVLVAEAGGALWARWRQANG